MNIYQYEVKKYLKSGLIWGFSIGLLITMFMAIYPAFAGDAQIMEMILEHYPPEMLKAFGMSNSLTMSTVLGFFAFVYVFVQLLLAVQASNYGFAVLSVEERELTADFLLTRPISRAEIITGKLLAVVTGLILTNGLIAGISFLAISIFRDGNPYDSQKIIMLLLSNFLFQGFFLSVGLLVTVFVRKVRSVLSFSIALAFMLYILNALQAIIGGKVLGLISPYYFFEANYILDKGEYKLSYTIAASLIILVSIGITYFKYTRRDIHSL